VRTDGPKPPPKRDGGALAYLKHDALGPAGDAALMIFNPGAAQATPPARPARALGPACTPPASARLVRRA
jgi:hypothetical protein